MLVSGTTTLWDNCQTKEQQQWNRHYTRVLRFMKFYETGLKNLRIFSLCWLKGTCVLPGVT